ncbi:MAG: MFS transporter [Syntrophorhabdales bacterium]|jgi:MFS family permease
MGESSSNPAGATVLFHNRPFVCYWLARVSTAVAYQMLSVAVGWQIYALTGRVLYLGLVGLVQFVPTFFLTLIVGQVADRFDRRAIVRLCQFMEGAGALALAAGSRAGRLDERAIFAIVFIVGVARAFENPTTQALLPNLVSGRMFPRAVAWATSSTQTAFIIGPALGGIIYAAGPAHAYLTIGALFLCAGLLVSLIRIERTAQRRDTVGVGSLFAGIAFIRRKPAVLGAISLDLVAVLLGGATALLPVYAREILLVGPQGLGLLRSAPSAGALLMSLFLARHPLRHRVGRTMFFAVIVFGAATVAFGVSTSFPLSLGALAVLGAADVISVVIRQSLVQIETPDVMRGRVSAINSMFIGTSNQLGEFESGLTAAWFGVVPAVMIGGIGTIITALVWMRLFPDLRGVDGLGTG